MHIRKSQSMRGKPVDNIKFGGGVKQRKISIEIIRILAIFMIVLGHTFTHGHASECLLYNKIPQSCRGDSSKLQREFPQ